MYIIVLAFLSIFAFPANSSHINVSPAPPEEHAVILRRRVVLVRSPKLARQFPHKKRAVVIYPEITGLSDPGVARRVRALVDFKNLFGSSLKEYREDAWLAEFDYKINHNANSLLDITFHQSGSGAYPDDHEKHLLINLKDGREVKAADAFRAEKLADLAAAVDKKLQAELKTTAAELAADKNTAAEERESIKQAYENLKFETSHLDEFSINGKQITFLYDAGFPHVIQALAPVGRYVFTYAELKPYIRPDGPLGQFVR